MLTTHSSFAADTAPPFIAGINSAGITNRELAVIVNDKDPLSQQITDYYQLRRAIPPENIIHISFKPHRSQIDPAEFALLKKQVDEKTPKTVQAFALTWAAPYRVGCMSISSAFAFGFSESYCASGCKETKKSPYAGSPSRKPFDDFAIRPTMLIAANSFADAQQLIDRGIQSDSSLPFNGAAYLVETPDANRSVRKVFFPFAEKFIGHDIPIKEIKAKAIYNQNDVMFYFTGDVFVDGITTNHYLPGAMADHLTSTGGQLTDSGQMSALKWLQAGATGSYGTVVEPCNILGKFPHPIVAIGIYLKGETLIEAYWKSVLMPGQGVFIGEPLAKPYFH